MVRGKGQFPDFLLSSSGMLTCLPQSLEVVITSIIPSFRDIPNTFGRGSDVTPSELICVFIFWIICLVMVWFPPTVFKHAAKVASVAVLITFISIVSVCCARAGGAGP
jgi:NCS1 family nucleobase:cation symporter-1